jgi:hypothetical protein
LVKEAGLTPYISDHYSDSQLSGLNNRSSNGQNWTVQDGDNPPKVYGNQIMRQTAPKGHIMVSVAVDGPKSGIRFEDAGYHEDEEYGGREMFQPNDLDSERAATKIMRAFKNSGAKVTEVRRSGFDAGFGTKNVNFDVIIKKS